MNYRSHPLYPPPRFNIQHNHPKMNIADLMRVYDELTSVGLYVIPKQATKKIPVWQFWKKEDRQTLRDRKEAMEYQLRDDVSGWCVATGLQSGRVVVLDFDSAEIIKYGLDPSNVYENVQNLSETLFVLKSPSNGVHLYYRLSDTQEMVGNIHPPVRGIDVRGEGGQVVTLGGYNLYEGADAEKKGVPSGHVGTYEKVTFGEYSNIPVMSDELYTWLTSPVVEKPKNAEHVAGEAYAHSPLGMDRLTKHFQQDVSARERLTLECLTHVLAHWTPVHSYEQWYQMWMSAHHASSGSGVIRDYILQHDNIHWHNGDAGRTHFRQAWDGHVYREGGFTASSLFYLAKQNGWLADTGFEIPDELCQIINHKYVADWVDTLDAIPSRLLLMSQTGSGKTYTIRKLYDRLGSPKTVVFVPSIKLATELCHTLRDVHGLPATLYRDDDGRTKDGASLVDAQVLVTTLQTFATKVHEPMSSYGLVYIEESDQLLQQFARGGGGIYGSHVSEQEARNGYRVIREAMEQAGTVWYVDATMSQVSYTVANATGTNVHVVRNKYVKKKAEVLMVDEKSEAYLAVLTALERGKQVVVACDTATVAEEIVETMGMLLDRRSIVITRKTERNPAVVKFMSNINVEAGNYDLIAYNSVMASGVSITDVTPDLIVQICTYLTPRINLQMLNRFRNQERVICFYRTGERLYARNVEELDEEIRRRSSIEAGYIGIPLLTRTSDAELRTHVALMSVSDGEQQERSPREFYKNLLKGDGREVRDANDITVPAMLEGVIEQVREIRKTRKDTLADTWQEVPPIDSENPPSPDYTPYQIAQGEVHALIVKALRGNVPMDRSPREIFDIVTEFNDVSFQLSALVRQDHALRRADEFVADRGRALTTLSNHVTLIKVIGFTRELYPSLDAPLDTERYSTFLQLLSENKDKYDAVINRAGQKYDVVIEKNPTPEEQAVAFAKILLAKVGLKQRTERVSRAGGETQYEHRIVNIEQAKQFLEWRWQEPVTINLEDRVSPAVLNRAEIVQTFKNLSTKDQEAVLDMIARDSVPFELAVVNFNIKDNF